eukprot:CAMPEP_0204455742 /NCGR_PEP_ID=MMETSP0471-20130131/1518_1 /ASSEMBLY_ACC=CAM_ASM_000602 /TAXON_ID=2969 /ORGANISM="Oxyrrhis marina" /LENGTH=207 /DNA_ID=CAMNT_0051455869 /DNA_START=55 /DNA_END=678 /DNA_ORIENTATION=+
MTTMWTTAQLQGLNKAVLRQRALDARDAVGAAVGVLGPVPRDPEALVAWIIKAQGMVGKENLETEPPCKRARVDKMESKTLSERESNALKGRGTADLFAQQEPERLPTEAGQAPEGEALQNARRGMSSSIFGSSPPKTVLAAAAVATKECSEGQQNAQRARMSTIVFGGDDVNPAVPRTVSDNIGDSIADQERARNAARGRGGSLTL